MAKKLEIGSLYKLKYNYGFRVGSASVDYVYIHPKDDFIFLFLGTRKESLKNGGLLDLLDFNVFLCLSTGKKCYDATNWEPHLLKSLYEIT